MLASRRRTNAAGDAPAEAGASRWYLRPWSVRPRVTCYETGYFCAFELPW